MPLYPPRGLEPYSKKELLEKREQRLRHDILAGCSEIILRRSAEKVRAAQLSILKSQHELLRFQTITDESTRQLTNIERTKKNWTEMPVEAVLDMYRTSHA